MTIPQQQDEQLRTEAMRVFRIVADKFSADNILELLAHVHKIRIARPPESEERTA